MRDITSNDRKANSISSLQKTDFTNRRPNRVYRQRDGADGVTQLREEFDDYGGGGRGYREDSRDASDNDLIEHRFRVDRKKLEQMLQSINDSDNDAATFFRKVMNETDTEIYWPSRLKIGAKSKKDPHIKITGYTDKAVKKAKDLIVMALDTRKDRVTIKMDIPYTDHSHIIGLSGNSIRRVMQSTECHIHFPDSNKTSNTEKSNQVSIAGGPKGAETARAQIRNLLPLIFSFDLPVTGQVQTLPEESNPSIQKIKTTYNIQIQFKQKRANSIQCIVRGSEFQAENVLRGVRDLMMCLIDNVICSVGLPVSMMIEVTPYFHWYIRGVQDLNAQLIMQQSGAQLIFPDPTSQQLSKYRPSTIIITGMLENVYRARQMLIGSLPLSTCFDIPEDLQINELVLFQMMNDLDVSISVRQKGRQGGIRQVVVKGLERNASNIYQVRRVILMEEGSVIAQIPMTWYIPNAPRAFYLNGHKLDNYGEAGWHYQPPVMNVRPGSPLGSPISFGISGFNNRPVSIPPGFIPIHPMSTNINSHFLPPSSRGSSARNSAATSFDSGTFSIVTGGSVSSYGGSNHGRYSNSRASSCYGGHEPSLASTATSRMSSPTETSHSVSPVDSSVTGFTSRSASRSPEDFARDDDEPCRESRALQLQDSGAETQLSEDQIKCFNNLLNLSGVTVNEKNRNLADLELKRIQAIYAFQQKPKGPEYRIPNDEWSGYLFSKSMPAAVLQDLTNGQNLADLDLNKTSLYHTSVFEHNSLRETDPSIWRNSNIASNATSAKSSADSLATSSDSGQFSGTCLSTAENSADSAELLGGYSGGYRKDNKKNRNDLVELLASLELGAYAEYFLNQDIDIGTFLTLTEQDLKDIGIMKVGPRRKIINIIQKMNISTPRKAPKAEGTKVGDCFTYLDRAPGAERSLNTNNQTAKSVW